MRAVLATLVGCVGIFVTFIFSAVTAINAHSWSVFFILFFLGIGATWAAMHLILKKPRTNMDAWLVSAADCRYRAAWDGCGIALDEKAARVRLAAKIKGAIVEKSYAFPDIREWGYEMAGVQITTPRQVIGGGVEGASHNVGQHIGAGVANAVAINNAIDNTGLWLKVRDIDYPKWFIKFRCRHVRDKDTELELQRWMEILSQYVNG